MNDSSGLAEIMGIFGKAVIDVYKAFEFRLFGIDFNLWQLLLWGVIACFLIDCIKDLIDV